MLNLVSIAIIVIVNCSHHVIGQTIVWDDYRDLCHFHEASLKRVRNRCENSLDLIVEKRMYRDEEPFWCIAINNRAQSHHDIRLKFSGPKSTRTTDYGLYAIGDVILIADGEHFEYYNITRSRTILFAVYPSSMYYDMQTIVSIELDGVEMCTGADLNSTEVIHPNQPNTNLLRYFRKCRWIDNRVHRPPNRCELLNQVIYEELSFNGEELFYCIVIDRTKTLSLRGDGNDTLVLEFSNKNYISTWSRNSTKLPQIDRTAATFKIGTDLFYLAIGPRHKNLSRVFTNILSMKFNNRESCRLRIDPHKEYITCGVRKINHQGLITFGYPTYHGKYPWHAAIYQIAELGSQKYICGGSIVSSSAIVTAAHCVQNTNGVKTPEILRVQLGKWDLSIINSDTKEFRVIEVIPHYEFDVDYLENDIAILRLQNQIEYTKYIQPVCISGQKDTEFYINRIGFVPGWGTNELEVQNAVLHEAGMPIASHQECRRSKRNFFSQFLNENNFCAGFRNGTSVCEGDSGGGLVFELETGWHLKGIVSLGTATIENRCDVVEYVLFTDVTKFFDWIYNHIIILV